MAFTDANFVVDQTAYVALPIDRDMNELYVLGFLSSRLIYWYFKNENNEFDNLFPKIKTKEFKNLPLFTATGEEQQPIISLVTQILAAKQADPKADTSVWEAEIDQLVYGLYGLGEEEIRIVEGT